MKIKDVQYEKASRKDFAKVGDFIEMPNLIQVQKRFIQLVCKKKA